MNNAEFDELAGRIEGLARAYQVLAGLLQREHLLDEQVLQARLRGYAQAYQHHPESNAHPAAIEALTTIADNLLRDALHLRGKPKEQIEEVMESVRNNPDPEGAA